MTATREPFARSARAALLVSALVVIGTGLVLAAGNRHPGSPDSLNNLITAREIAAGRGYTTRIVHQFWAEQPVPGPETVRPPGIPFVLAAIFAVVGPGVRSQVVLNVLTLLATALVMRVVLRQLGARAFADAVAALFLVSGAFEPLSIWNNNALVLFTALLLLAAVAGRRAALGAHAYTVLGVVAAGGMYMKESFLATAVAVGVVQAAFDGGLSNRAQRLRAFVWYAVVLATLTSPWWVRNLVLFGHPFYNPMGFARLAARYGGGPNGFEVLPNGAWWTVRYGHPLGYRELIDTIGIRTVVAREAAHLGNAALAIVSVQPIVAGLACIGIARWRRELLPLFALAVALLGDVALSSLYTSVDHRYLWPAQVPLALLAWLAVDEIRKTIPAERERHWSYVLAAALALGGYIGATSALSVWRARFAITSLPPPPWREHLRNAVAVDAIVMTDDPWGVAWFTERSAVMAPAGTHADLEEVLRRYRPTHFLWTSIYRDQSNTPFARDELALVMGGFRVGRPWTFYRIQTPSGVPPP